MTACSLGNDRRGVIVNKRTAALKSISHCRRVSLSRYKLFKVGCFLVAQVSVASLCAVVKDVLIFCGGQLCLRTLFGCNPGVYKLALIIFIRSLLRVLGAILTAYNVRSCAEKAESAADDVVLEHLLCVHVLAQVRPIALAVIQIEHTVCNRVQDIREDFL